MNPQSVQRTMKRNRPALSLSLTVMTVILLAGCKTTPSNKDPQSMSADLRIRVTHEVLHPVNKRLFGQFLEKPSWGGETGPEAALLPGTRQIDPRVEEMMRDMEIPVVRFPGGTDVDYLDWRDMVTDARGPGAGRPNSISRRHGGENDIITNGFGYDEYFQLAGRLGWETILVVNLRDGLLTETSPEAAAEHAAALLAYCAGDSATLPEAFRQWPELRAANGHPAPYPVEYVQIGNEAWWAEQMKKKHGDAWIQIWADAIESYIAALRGIAPDVKSSSMPTRSKSPRSWSAAKRASISTRSTAIIRWPSKRFSTRMGIPCHWRRSLPVKSGTRWSTVPKPMPTAWPRGRTKPSTRPGNSGSNSP
jgi:hypothetical protein